MGDTPISTSFAGECKRKQEKVGETRVCSETPHTKRVLFKGEFMFIFMYYKTSVNLFYKSMNTCRRLTGRSLKKNLLDKYSLTALAPVHASHCSCDAKISFKIAFVIVLVLVSQSKNGWHWTRVGTGWNNTRGIMCWISSVRNTETPTGPDWTWHWHVKC